MSSFRLFNFFIIVLKLASALFDSLFLEEKT